jgi:ketosteroid isomerase-like protein
MTQKNRQIVDAFFQAYGKRDIEGVKLVMAEEAIWHFPGSHPLAGIKRGVGEIVAFFDAMGKIMRESNPKIDKLIVAENEDHVIECIHSTTHRTDGIDLDHRACVLWTLKGGKIIEGRHFFSDPGAMDRYFTAVAGK